MLSELIDTLCRYGHASYLCYQMGDKRKAIGWWDQEIAILKEIVGEDHPRYRKMVTGRDNLRIELEEDEGILRGG